MSVEEHIAPRRTNQSRVGCVVALALVTALAGFAIWAAASSDSDDGGNPAPTAQEEQVLRDYLAQATEHQDICYGWRLTFTDNYNSTGTHTSTSVPPPSCPSWVVLEASVTWTSSSSESNDYGTVRLQSSPDLAGKLPSQSALSEAGITDDAFTDYPSGALYTGLQALPLLMVESAGVPTVPPASTSAAPTSVQPAWQPDSSDNWRENGSLIILGVVALLLALLLVAGGVVSLRRTRRAQHSAAGGTPPQPPAPQGANPGQAPPPDHSAGPPPDNR